MGVINATNNGLESQRCVEKRQSSPIPILLYSDFV